MVRGQTTMGARVVSVAVLAAVLISSVAGIKLSVGEDLSHQVKVTGLPKDVKTVDVAEFFHSCGAIAGVTLFAPKPDDQFLPPRGTAEVTFKDKYSVQCAVGLNGQKYKGQTLFVESSEKKKDDDATLESMKADEKKQKEDRKKKDAEMLKLLGKKSFDMMKASEKQDKETKPDMKMGAEELKKIEGLTKIANKGRAALKGSMAKLAQKIEGQQKKLADMTKTAKTKQKAVVGEQVDKVKNEAKELKEQIENTDGMKDEDKQATIGEINSISGVIGNAEDKAAGGPGKVMDVASQVYLKQLGVLQHLKGQARIEAKQFAPKAFEKKVVDGKPDKSDPRVEGFKEAEAKLQSGQKTGPPLDPLIYGWNPHLTMKQLGWSMRHLPKGGLTKNNFLPNWKKAGNRLPQQTYTKVNYLPASHKVTAANTLPSAPKRSKKNFLPKAGPPPPPAVVPRNIPENEQNKFARCSYCEQAVVQVAHVGPAHMWEWCRGQGYDALLCQSVLASVSHAFAAYTAGKYTYREQFRASASFAAARPAVCKAMCVGGKETIYAPVKRVNLQKD